MIYKEFDGNKLAAKVATCFFMKGEVQLVTYSVGKITVI